MSESVFEVKLVTVGDKKMNVVNVIRQLTGEQVGVILRRVNACPVAVLSDASYDIAKALSEELRAVGAKVELVERGALISSQSRGNDELKENGVKVDTESKQDQLTQLQTILEEQLISRGRLDSFFQNAENMYIQIYLTLETENFLKTEIIIETDGYTSDIEETEEEINDYVHDNGLSDGLYRIFGDSIDQFDREVLVSIKNYRPEINHLDETKMSDDRLEAAINTLTAVKDKVAGGNEILPGEDAYEWILEVSQILTEILDEADG